MSADRIIHERLSIGFEYPVVFTRGALDPAHPALADALTRRGDAAGRVRALCYVDGGLWDAQPDFAARFSAYIAAHEDRLELAGPVRRVPGGEAVKNEPDRIWAIAAELLRSGLCRHSCVIVAGGGAVLDAVGLAVSLAHRGLRLVRMPSTTLAQDDAGIGVKNGINFDGVKNALGVFAPPFAVINDFDLLRTLSMEDWIGGVAEAIKVGIIRDAGLFREVGQRAERLRARDAGALEEVVFRCAEAHLAHIRRAGDPFEQGAARPLDFGHWAAHALESLSGYRVRHGQAVAFGIRLDARYAIRKGWIDASELNDIESVLDRCGFPAWYPDLERVDTGGRPVVLDGIERFREHLGGRLCVTFPRGIGASFEVGEIDESLMREGLEEIRTRHGAG